MNQSTLAEKIRELRRKRSWTQMHLAEAARVSLRTIQRIEDGESCSRETLLSLASAFDIDITELTKCRTSYDSEPRAAATESVAQNAFEAPFQSENNQLVALLREKFDVIFGFAFMVLSFIFLIVAMLFGYLWQ